MANEKILNTRIALKIDSLENWNKSTLGLKKGELAIATVAATAGNGLTEPVCMIKIGEDGVKTFKDLEWNFYAKASDVLSACKSEDALKTFVNGVIADAGIASSEAMEALAGRVTATEGAITTLNGDESTAGSVAKAIKDAIDALDLANTYAAKEHEHTKADITDFAHNHEISEVNGLQDALDGLQAAGDYAAEEHTHTKSEITDFAHTHTASEVTDLDTTIKGYDYATKTEAQGYANAKDGAIAEAKKAGDDAAAALDVYKGEMTTALAGKQGVIPENTYDVHGSAAKALEDAKQYTDDEIAKIPAQTDYSVTITEDTDDATVAKTYVFTQCGEEIGSIKLAKELVVTSGSVKEVAEDGKPYADAKVGDKYIELVIANQDAPIYVPAKDLVDIYTAKDGATEIQVAISNTNEISATLVNGGVTEEKLAEGVRTKLNKTWEEVGVAKGLVDALEGGQVKANKEAIEAINDTEDGILAQAKGYADGLAGNYAEKTHTHETSDINGLSDHLINELNIITSNITVNADENKATYYMSTNSKEASSNTTFGGFGIVGGNHVVVGEDHGAFTISTDITDATADTVGLVKLGAEGGAATYEGLQATDAIAKNALVDADLTTDAGNVEIIISRTEASGDYSSDKALIIQGNDYVEFTNSTNNTCELQATTALTSAVANANSAVQTVTAPASETAPSGIVATRTGNDVTLAIDDTITWIFDCGGAGV